MATQEAGVSSELLAFATIDDARVLAFELGMTAAASERKLLVAVALAVRVAMPTAPNDHSDAGSCVAWAGCWASLLARLLSEARFEGRDVSERTVTVNIDRFFLRSPCEMFWITLSWSSCPFGASTFPRCKWCWRAPELPLICCRLCYSGALRKLEGSRPHDYGNIDYWEQEHAADETDSREWFLAWEEFRPAFLRAVAAYSPGAIGRVLIPGNGRSAVAQHIAIERIFSEVVATDAADGVTSTMKSRGLLPTFITDDISHSSLEPASFDCLLDKGLLDALACNISSSAAIVKHSVGEYHRLLVPGGLAIIISGRSKPAILCPFVHDQWEVLWETRYENLASVGRSSTAASMAARRRLCFFIVLRKRIKSSQDALPGVHRAVRGRAVLPG